MEQIGAKRMKCALKIWLPFYRNPNFAPAHEAALLKMSASTLERILHAVRQAMRPQGWGLTQKGSYPLLMHRIPIQTKDFNIQAPGHLEGVTVHHCGGSVLGEYVHTLTHTDIFSSWTELRAIPNRAASSVLEATKDMKICLPFPILSADYDNGSEFINYEMENYFVGRKNPVHFVRSRPYKKNDQCFVEQKNFTHVREIFGYDRIMGRELAIQMTRIYKELWCPLHNYFLPAQKLLSKTRVGARYVKRYDLPRTPYQRLLESADLSGEAKTALEMHYEKLNPFDLRLGLEMELKSFFELFNQQQHSKAA